MPDRPRRTRGTFALGWDSVTAATISLVTVPFFGPNLLTLATGSQDATLTISG
jgi:hypothetical protein